jgi:hypothetical protein
MIRSIDCAMAPGQRPSKNSSFQQLVATGEPTIVCRGWVSAVDRLLALVWLRFRLWWNGLHSQAKAADTAVAVIIVFLGGAFSVGVAVGLSAVAHLALSDGDAEARRVGLNVVMWVLGLIAVVVPTILGIGQSSVPLGRLAAFPFSRWNLYRISLAASFVVGVHFFWYPIILAVSATVIFFGDVPAVPWLAIVAVFVVCQVVWCHTGLLFVQRVLRRRRTREVAALVGLVVLVSVSYLPVLLTEETEPDQLQYRGPSAPVVSTIVGAASFFPPSIAAAGLMAGIETVWTDLFAAIAWLVLWTAAGLAFGFRIVSRSLFEGDVSVKASKAASGLYETRSAKIMGLEWFTRVPTEVRAVAAKELTYLMRSTVGKFNIVVMPIFVAVVGLVFARDLTRPVLGIDPTTLVFVGSLVYATAFANNFVYNTFAWDGSGASSYFQSPVVAERVLFGKNLGVWMYTSILGVECALCYFVVVGKPALSAVVSGGLAFFAALVTPTMIGNFISVAMPVPRDSAKITNSPSQTAILVSFGVLLLNVVLVGGLVAIPALLGFVWLQPIFLAVLLAVEVLFYRVLLRVAGRLLEDRREELVEALQVAA